MNRSIDIAHESPFEGVYYHAKGVGDIHEGLSMKVVNEDSCHHKEQTIRNRKTRKEKCGNKKTKTSSDEGHHREENSADRREFYGFFKDQIGKDSSHMSGKFYLFQLVLVRFSNLGYVY